MERIAIDDKSFWLTIFGTNGLQWPSNLRANVESAIVNSGLDKSRIDIHVAADKAVSKEEMSEIEKAIRRQGVTREFFWTD